MMSGEEAPTSPVNEQVRLHMRCHMNKRVLVIDDSIVILELLHSMLDLEGYEVLTATDGSAAFEQLETTTPDLILLDLLMPKMSGYEFIEQVRHCRKPLVAIPIILLTARKHTPQEIEQLGVAGYLQKPFHRSELLSLLSDPATAPL